MRLRWGFLDEMILAPWVHRAEPTLFGLMRQASETGRPLESVMGTAQDRRDPWARVRQVHVVTSASNGLPRLVDAYSYEIDRRDIQLARLGERGAMPK